MAVLPAPRANAGVNTEDDSRLGPSSPHSALRRKRLRAAKADSSTAPAVTALERRDEAHRPPPRANFRRPPGLNALLGLIRVWRTKRQKEG